MTMCTIRVELHDASWFDYSNLATNLKNCGITDVITANDGERFKMSPGHYNYDGWKSFDQVYNDTVACAMMVGKRHAVTVSHVSENRWIGLPRL